MIRKKIALFTNVDENGVIEMLDVDTIYAVPLELKRQKLDDFVRTLEGGRISLLVGLVATVVSLLIGVSYGATAGYFGGITDRIMMRAVDIVYALPFMFFVILLMVVFGRHIILIFVAIGAVNWLDMARIVRGQTLGLKRMEYVEAARACGVDNRAIISRCSSNRTPSARSTPSRAAAPCSSPTWALPIANRWM